MKHAGYLSSLFFAAGLCLPALARAQAVRPLAFGYTPHGIFTNWYNDYAGVRLEINSPAAIAGIKFYTTSNDGSGGSDQWGAEVTAPMVNYLAILPTDGDSLATSALPAASMTGKIAIVWRGGNQFGTKALAAQNAGAAACIIINNIPGDPPNMGSCTDGPLVHIPVFMISYEDGLPVDGQLHAGSPVYITLTPWGSGYGNDIGIVPQGGAAWHNYAIPYTQLSAAGGAFPYKGSDGAFIANFGGNAATHASLTDTVTFAPDSAGSTVVINTSAISYTGNFLSTDSILAFSSPAEYDMTLPAGATTGRYDIKYTISSDSTDENLLDNTYTTSFYATDNVYSKGRYDVVNHKPIFAMYKALGGPDSVTGSSEFLWGPMYYVAHGGSALAAVQYSVATELVTSSPYIADPILVYIFKWVDGYNDSADLYTYPHDSIVQNGELQLVAAGYNSFSLPAAGDTIGGVITQPIYTDTINFIAHTQYVAEDNTWYYVAVDVPDGYYLGFDDKIDAYPRVFSRYHANSGYTEYNNIYTAGGRYNMFANGNNNDPAMLFTGTTGTRAVDSFNFRGTHGFVPAVAMITAPATAGASALPAPIGNAELYPNPATDHVDVSIALASTAKTLSYTILNASGQIVAKEVHSNVLNETCRFSTATLPAGNYFMVIAGNDKVTFRKFAVVK